ncbi:sigma-54-dependent Fis family transcriptional regulator [Sandaracinus amylolyticus]|uniref:Two component, sigma54 specific, transcriptional regulator, Fis family n=1 Tax=Sandaracinus amylolyticus TaxID=927083 RepID=A0A0F6SHE7_9BACT|nr:sigma 54-interacting transcriptional regulator [Sandaracinus amylolyticus]AKF10314.1 two component, sigma54 specific, transcriptional regulator, Fis family [Sandaracinus amylolyticus]
MLSPRLVLRVLDAPDRDLPVELPLRDEPLVIGRATNGGRSISIRDPRLSRWHLSVMRDGRGARVRDASTNGTFVLRQGARARRVRYEAVIADGDVLRVGDTFLLLREAPSTDDDVAIDGVLGRAPRIVALRAAVDALAASRSSVLVTGESGTGKSTVARALHARSGRAGAFVAMRGSAVMAPSVVTALIEQARGGTLFLSDVDELPSAVQSTLVHDSTRLACISVDVRLVAASHRDLGRAIADGRLRSDLHAQLSERTLATPPLRARREDILPILRHALGADAPPLAPSLVEALLAHDWPFHVRELLTVATELRVRGVGATCLELDLVAARLDAPHAATPSIGPASGVRSKLGAPSREDVERAWREADGNVSEVARRMRRSRRQVRRYLEQYGITPVR